VAKKEKPKVILAGFSAYPRELDYQKFTSIAQEVGAITVADMSHVAGLIAGKVHKNPFDFGFDVITATTHKTLRGPRGGLILTREDEKLAQKIDKSVFPGLQGGPHMNNIIAKSICFYEAQQPSFQQYAQQILKNAKAMESVFQSYNIRMITGGTSNHLLLLDTISSFGISGKEAQIILDAMGITVNMNMIADDTRSPFDPSGIRLGTPAITTRGMKESEATQIAEWIVKILKNNKNEQQKEQIKEEMQALTQKFPLFAY